jgi:hypothetical protein
LSPQQRGRPSGLVTFVEALEHFLVGHYEGLEDIVGLLNPSKPLQTPVNPPLEEDSPGIRENIGERLRGGTSAHATTTSTPLSSGPRGPPFWGHLPGFGLRARAALAVKPTIPTYPFRLARIVRRTNESLWRQKRRQPAVDRSRRRIAVRN